ncbi:MAG: Serine/threonine-protein phosphatase 2A activator 2 [Chrysothrix sp. TS-e1954]|nr:MAG: Serine/threonine-protein phosphatase 2A activator 2 [Chrysothrix sp. TS-e1954]
MPSATTQSRVEPLPDSAIPLHPPDLSQKLPKLTPRSNPPKKRTANSRSSPNPSIPTPCLPSPPEVDSIRFVQPTRRILTTQDHELFLQSPAHTLITSFAFTLSDAVRDTTISAAEADLLQNPCPIINGTLGILTELEDLIAQHPPDHASGSRFGNPIFRDYLASVSTNLPQWHARHLPSTSSLPPAALDELTTYLHASLGSSSRIDYGSGHELHFLIYLLLLHQLSLLPSTPLTHRSLALIILPRYLRLMRTLQSTYYLEPAGSHGVWGLDDYHFLPFLLGASQLTNHAFITPRGIHNEALLDEYADEFLYLDMVRQVNASKTVKGLRWHSPMLDDISSVRGGWAKVEQGMRRMFLGEVLGKLVVMQHFLFGGVVGAVEGMTREGERGAGVGEGEGEEHEGHEHKADSWDDCCGIKVPSNVGAVQEMRRKMGGTGELRRVPFD